MAQGYKIFLSHSWTISQAHERLLEMLQKDPYFIFTLYQVPPDSPVHRGLSNGAQLTEQIRQYMQPCNIVFILDGRYSSYKKWINKEIAVANELKKPIIATCPWGIQQVSGVVHEACTSLAVWNAEAIINAIRAYAKSNNWHSEIPSL